MRCRRSAAALHRGRAAVRGPLVSEFEERLAQLFGVRAGCVVSASSGTIALVGSILATVKTSASQQPLAITPAFTFVATGLAIELAGYRPYLADVDARTWMLDPDRLLTGIDPAILKQTSFVMPVAAFGRSVPPAPWREFQRKTGIAVIIDAAAAFEGISDSNGASVGSLPTVVSLHATKSFGIGEGGFVATSDAALAKRVMQALNYGFYGSRESLTAGTNGKLTEYHAAVGLAELDGWIAKRAALKAVADTYRAEFGNRDLLDRVHGSGDVASCYALFTASSAAEASRIGESLKRNGIDFRLWYGTGMQNHRHLKDLPREPLPVTEDLAPRIIGLPMSLDLSRAQVQRVVDSVIEGLSNA